MRLTGLRLTGLRLTDLRLTGHGVTLVSMKAILELYFRLRVRFLVRRTAHGSPVDSPDIVELTVLTSVADWRRRVLVKKGP